MTADIAVVPEICRILAGHAQRKGGQGGDSNVSLVGYPEYLNTAPTDSKWHTDALVTASD